MGIVYQDVESTLSIRELTPASLELTSDTPNSSRTTEASRGPAAIRQPSATMTFVGIKYITENGTHVPPLVHAQRDFGCLISPSARSNLREKSDGLPEFPIYDDAEKPYHDVGFSPRRTEDVPYQ